MTFDASAVAAFLFDTSVRAAVAAVAVAVVLWILRVRAATVRHAAWTAMLAAMLLMPALLSVVPTLPMPERFLRATAADIREPALPLLVESTPRPLVPVSDVPPSGEVVRAATLQAAGQPATPARQWLPQLVVTAYAVGVLLFFGRLLYGWRLAFHMIRRAKRAGPLRLRSEIAVRSVVTAPLYESPEVAVPMTAGAIRPVIVLPLAWKDWSPETLAAVVAHETAHVRRRDALTSLLARLNRALFWFHPLAWWLERQVALTAEHACDEEAARVVAGPRRYAEILVEMADAVRRNRGRVVWQGVGVDGAGLLRGRIERVLSGGAHVSKVKATGAVVACVTVILLVVACRPQIQTTPLREDPELAQRLASQDENTRKFEAARDMTQTQADALEQKVAANPQDFETRRQLVAYYRASSTVAWDKKVPGLRRHALWLIEHHPEHELVAPALSPQYDAEGFAAAKKLWDAHLLKTDASPFLVYRAAMFFAPHDKPYAEQLILRGMAMDPESAALKARMAPNAGGYQWPSQLADLYASALVGSESMAGTYNDLRTHLDKLKTPFAIAVLEKLEASSNAALLARVGTRLTWPRNHSKDPAIKEAGDRANALGVRYLQRALQLDPKLESAQISLYMATAGAKQNEADRLANRAHERYMISEDIADYAEKNPGKAKKEREEALHEAHQVLDMAKAHAGDPEYSAAIMTAHHVLATQALREGNREQAVLHLRESVKVPTSDQIKYVPPLSWMRPVNRLLKAGERAGVVEFLEAYARLTVRERQRLLDDARAIREGRMPSAYQHMVYRETAGSPFKPMR